MVDRVVLVRHSSSPRENHRESLRFSSSLGLDPEEPPFVWSSVVVAQHFLENTFGLPSLEFTCHVWSPFFKGWKTSGGLKVDVYFLSILWWVRFFFSGREHVNLTKPEEIQKVMVDFCCLGFPMITLVTRVKEEGVGNHQLPLFLGLFSRLTQGADTTFTSHCKSPGWDTAAWPMDVSFCVVKCLEWHMINSFSTRKDRCFPWTVGF